MEGIYSQRPYIDPEFEALIEKIYPARVCIDNDVSQDCTIVEILLQYKDPARKYYRELFFSSLRDVTKGSIMILASKINKCLTYKGYLVYFTLASVPAAAKTSTNLDFSLEVDSANKQGVLLDMVQILTDLDLVISKSYISSDGGWFMDVFHVTDQQGKKITDEGLIHYIRRALGATRRSLKEVLQSSPRPCRVLTKHTALEITGMDRQGLLFEVSAVLTDLGCHITAAVAWTHSARTACIISLEDRVKGGITADMAGLAHIKGRLQTVLEAHHKDGEKRCVRLLAPPVAGETHTERRLHQLMLADGDYEMCSSCGGSVDAKEDIIRSNNNSCGCAHVSIENCKEKGYSVVHLRCRDRPKLLFDTVCTLTDLNFVVFHAAINSKRSIAVQEYYIRHKDGCVLNSEKERQRVIQCLVAAIERRDSDGLRLDITATDRTGLLSDVTRVFREHGLSVSRAEVGTEGKLAKGTFYVTITGAAGHDIVHEVVEGLKRAIDGTVQVVESSSSSSSLVVDDHPKPFSLGSLLWSQIERLSSSFSLIKL